ncbi:MAG: hypothetical protein QOI73_3211, partial [Solirubrobacteraceae bacterium]|nr:hypothetical protein [Solirubrobacteraceae bacterium]
MADVSRGNAGAESMTAAPVGTLVVAGDTAYRERARGVLGELGPVTFALALPTDPEDVAWLVRQARPEVVVLDATGCETEVATVLAALAQQAPRVGVVVVCEHLTQAAQILRALPKWGWKRELRAAVELARLEGNPLVHRRTGLVGPRRDLRGADA